MATSRPWRWAKPLRTAQRSCTSAHDHRAALAAQSSRGAGRVARILNLLLRRSQTPLEGQRPFRGTHHSLGPRPGQSRLRPWSGTRFSRTAERPRHRREWHGWLRCAGRTDSLTGSRPTSRAPGRGSTPLARRSPQLTVRRLPWDVPSSIKRLKAETGTSNRNASEERAGEGASPATARATNITPEPPTETAPGRSRLGRVALR